MEDLGAIRTDRNLLRQQLSEEVASYVREKIILGEIRPGSFLRLEPIAEAVGVSNTPVREGLLMLRGEGFLRLVPRRGFLVVPFKPQDIRDIFWAQAELASELCARAAKAITPAQIVNLERNIEAHHKAISEGDEEATAFLGFAFHREINRAADSHRLAFFLDSIARQLPNKFYASIEGELALLEEEHPLLIEALRKHNVRQARSIMERHMLERGEHLIQMLEERGVWDQMEEDEEA